MNLAGVHNAGLAVKFNASAVDTDAGGLQPIGTSIAWARAFSRCR